MGNLSKLLIQENKRMKMYAPSIFRVGLVTTIILYIMAIVFAGIFGYSFKSTILLILFPLITSFYTIYSREVIYITSDAIYKGGPFSGLQETKFSQITDLKLNIRFNILTLQIIEGDKNVFISSIFMQKKDIILISEEVENKIL